MQGKIFIANGFIVGERNVGRYLTVLIFTQVRFSLPLPLVYPHSQLSRD